MKRMRHSFVICLLSFVFCHLSLHSQLPSYVPTSGLVGYWSFNGNANDESGNGNNGTVTGATLTTDRFGVANKAYSFNGTNNYIRINSAPNLNVSSFTISGWFNASTLPTDDFLGAKGIFGKWWQTPNVCNGNYNAYLVCLTKPAVPNTPVIGGATSFYEGNLFYANTAISANSWYHFVFIHDATSGGKLYINGVLYSTNTSLGALCNSTNAIHIGADMNNGNLYRFFGGKLDDFGLWNRTLTAQEISNLYTTTAPPPIAINPTQNSINCGESTTLTVSSTASAQPCLKAELPATLQNGLVGYWPFCGNANDASGNNNNGTVNGASLTTDRFGNANSAYSFDGNDFILMNSINVSTPYTITAWLKSDADIISSETNSNSNSGATYISQGASNSPCNYCDFGLGLKSAPYFSGSNACPSTYYNVERGNGCTFIHLSECSPSHSFASNWVQVVYNFNGTNLNFYLNGVLQWSQAAPPLNNSGFPLCFGARYVANYGALGFWKGKLDDIAIYNRALSASEIQQLYALGNVTYAWSTGATTPSITVSPGQTTSYSVTATNSAGSTTSSVTVNVADSLTWTGLYDTDWHKPCNWSPQFVPKCCNNVAVPVTTNQPIVSGIAAAEDLTIYTTSGAQVTVNNGANLQIADCPTTITTTACPSLAELTTTAVSSITQTTAISGGTISYQGASPITARGVCWGPTTNPTLTNSFTTNGTGTGTFTSNLTGLVGGTTYYVRAYATNSSGTSYGNELSFVAVNPQPAYPANSVFCASGATLVVDVTNPTTGKTWMDRNLGATQAATSSTDAAAYGDLYQWGRGNDGHQCRNSATTTTLSTTDQPGNANFILSPNAPYDWRSPQNANLWQGVNGVNNPCPSGYRVATQTELQNELSSWSENTPNGAFNATTRFTIGGSRNVSDGGFYQVNSTGYYWSSTISNQDSWLLSINGNSSLTYTGRGVGMSVRCIKDASAIPASIGALNCGSSIQTGTLISGTAANGVSVSVPYTGGNAGSYAAQTIVSTGVTGLTATLNAGVLAYGAGALSLTISGTPSTSGPASFSLTIGGQSCSFTLPVQIALAAQYPVGSIFCVSGPTAIVDVTNPTTGKTWMDRNLGATQAATSATDAAAYGDLYQWGRGNDGHQCRNSATTTTLSATDQPGNGLFIISPVVPNDWRVTQNNTLWLGVNGINNPCPAGYRLPTDVEMENERLTWTASTSVGAFNSPLKITMTGYRQESIVFNAGTVGNYWTVGINGTSIRNLNFSPSGAGLSLAFRSYGMTVRCIKN
jgi:uncharacterized protein (TIGR02145 family)